MEVSIRPGIGCPGGAVPRYAAAISVASYTCSSLHPDAWCGAVYSVRLKIDIAGSVCVCNPLPEFSAEGTSYSEGNCSVFMSKVHKYSAASSGLLVMITGNDMADSSL